jgi:hypothetical protein
MYDYTEVMYVDTEVMYVDTEVMYVNTEVMCRTAGTPEHMHMQSWPHQAIRHVHPAITRSKCVA